MKPILYRAGSRWPLFAAFAAAAAIHISALAFSPWHRPEIFDLGDLSEVTLESAPPDPETSSEPVDIPPVETLPPIEANKYLEEPSPTPPRITKEARPIHSSSGSSLARAAVGNGKVYALSAPLPDYPHQARARHVTGSGTVLLEIDPVSGGVLNARLTESTGSPILDNSAINGFRRWRFRSGTPSTVRIPFTFTMYGPRL